MLDVLFVIKKLILIHLKVAFYAIRKIVIKIKKLICTHIVDVNELCIVN